MCNASVFPLLVPPGRRIRQKPGKYVGKLFLWTCGPTWHFFCKSSEHCYIPLLIHFGCLFCFQMRFHSFVPNWTIFQWFSCGWDELSVCVRAADSEHTVQYSVGQCSVGAAESVQRKQVRHASAAWFSTRFQKGEQGYWVFAKARSYEY